MSYKTILVPMLVGLSSQYAGCKSDIDLDGNATSIESTAGEVDTISDDPTSSTSGAPALDDGSNDGVSDDDGGQSLDDGASDQGSDGEGSTPPAVPVITYAGSTFNWTKGDVITDLTPTNSGGPVTACSVTPPLPAGLAIDDACTISGTPTTVSLAADYAITPANASGDGIAITLNISVTASVSGPGTRQWAWIKGDQIAKIGPVPGTKGVPDAANHPSALYNYGAVIDSQDNIWIFGGNGFSADDVAGSNFNDLWKFDTSTKNWTWVDGTLTPNQAGIYDSKGAPSTTARPGGRRGLSMWLDNDDNIWIFGGYGRNAAGAEVWLQDLWKFDGSRWTWVWGDDTGGNLFPVAGAVGTFDASYSPAGRIKYGHWKDADGNFWLIGGKWGPNKYTMDVWKWNGSMWGFFGGNATANGPDSYAGGLGVSSALSYPGGDVYGDFWYDPTSNRVWIYGANNLEAMWKWDGTNFAFMGGSTATNPTPNYGSLGVPDSSNFPRTTNSANGQTWVDPSTGHLWLYGGYGKDAAGVFDELDALWKYDGTQWTWVGGSNSVNQVPVRGASEVFHASHTPGARDAGVALVDSRGKVWLIGGWAYTSPGSGGYLMDIWKFDL